MPSCSVLVAEDDANLRLITIRYLQQQGYTVYGAADGETARTALEQEAINVAVLDLDLLRLDGWALAQELRGRELRPKVVVLTAVQDIEIMKEQMPADPYLIKPFALLQLLRVLERLCPPTA